MGTTLTGKNISASYLGLLKTTDNAVIGGTAKIITDGNGNDSPLYLSTTRVGIGITPTSLLHVNGDANINTLTVGLGSGSISTNTVFGNNALKQNTTGYMNTAIGVDALRNNTDGDNNIAIGRLNLDANTSGIRNVALGNQSLTSNTTGSYNVGLGYDGLSALSSGGYNIGIGYEAGNNITTGTGSIMIGGVTRSSGVTSSNEIVIGYNTTGNGSNTVTIGNSSITTNYFSGDILLGNSENLFWGNTSDVYISGTTVSDNIQLGVGGSTQFTFSQASGLRLHQYGSGTITGTATQRLGVDSSGNVIEIPIGAGAVDGSGTANTVTMWSDTDTITDAPITISGNDSTFAGNVKLTGSIMDIRFIESDTTNVNSLIRHQTGLLRFDTISDDEATITTRVALDHSTGNVGIGTTSPDFTLDISNTTFGNQLRLHRSSVASGGFLTLSANDSAGNKQDYAKIGTIVESSTSGSEDGALVFQTSINSVLTERMRLDSSGNLLIAKTTTGGASVGVEARAVGQLFATRNGDNVGYFNRTTSQGDVIQIRKDNSTVGVIGTQNWGIGTASPSSPLEVVGGASHGTGITQTRSGHPSLSFLNGGTNSVYFGIAPDGGSYNTFMQVAEDGTDIDYIRFNTGAGSERARITSTGEFKGPILYEMKNNAGDQSGATSPRIYSPAGGTFAISCNNSERLRITSVGDLLVGKTSTTFSSAGTEIINHGQGNFTRDGSFAIALNRLSSDGEIQQFYRQTVQVGNISVTGSATTYNTSSDYRLKEDLQDFNALEIASKIKMYDFKWKENDSRSYGVMAHELEEVLPQAVSGEKDAEEMQSVDYSKLVPILLKSIQELKAEIDELKKNK